MSRLLGVAKTTLDDYTAAGCPGIPPGENGESGWSFDPALVLPWYAEYLKRSTKRASSSDYQQAKIAKISAEAELAQMKVDAEKGELVSVGFASKIIGEVLSETRSSLLAIPRSIAQEVAELSSAEDVADRIELALHESMTALQDALERKSMPE